MVRPEIENGVLEVLKLTTQMDLELGDAMEIYLRALVSTCMDAADGDHAIAAKWVDEWLMPNIKHFRDHLAQGGHTPPTIVGGHRIN